MLLSDGLRNQNNAASFRRLEELETKIENNMEQSQMLMGLRTKGYLEPALFIKKRIHWQQKVKGFLKKRINLLVPSTAILQK